MGRCLPELEKCVKCRGKNKPYVVRVEGLYYVRCGCGKWDRYFALGMTAKQAIETWNRFNREIVRGKYVPDEDDL